MNKGELLREMASRTGSTPGEAREHLHALQEIMSETLNDGGEVHIPGFGRFSVRQREGRRVAVFCAGKNLRESL